MAIKFLRSNIYLLLACLISSITWGQSQKKYVTENEYEQWTSMSAATLSPKGNWAYYTLSNTHIKGMTQPDKPADTLELVELKNMKKHIYPFGKNPQFAPNEKWFSFFKNDQWVLFDLTNKTETRTDSIRSAQFALNGKVTLLRYKNHPDKLTVYSNKDKDGFTLNNTKDFSVSPNKENMVVLQQNDSLFNLLLVDLKQPDKPILLKEKINNSSNFRWSDSGNLLAFYEETKPIKDEYKDHLLHCVNLKDRTKDKILYSKDIKGDFYLNKSSIVFTGDEKSINFTAFPINNTPEIIDPLIWRSSDPIQPPHETKYPKNIIHSWTLDRNQIKEIGTDDFQLLSSGDFKHFFLLDNANYLPSFNFGNFFSDIVRLDTIKSYNKVIEKEFIYAERTEAISFSPDGSYIARIKDRQWQLYNIEKDSSQCMTCLEKDIFTMDFNDSNIPEFPYDTAFFSTNGDEVLMTAQNNIYLYDIIHDKSSALFPKNSDFTYKIAQNPTNRNLGIYYTIGIKPGLDLKQGIFIIQYNTNTQEESLYLYKLDKKPKLITVTPHKIASPKMAGNAITYILSNYNLPPQIVYWENGKETVVKQSNLQQQKYYWGHSELLTYPGPYGSTLKGTLFYPGNYNPKKKYPVVLKIYSDVSLMALKKYIPLTLQNPVGWNNAVFTTQDYFVFMPDITYKINHTGESALKSVLAGVDAISKIQGVDTFRIGLFGHSFGGYEVSYIATQTDKFKTIVSFAGWHDLVDTYTTIDDIGLFNYYRFEHNQLRIKAPFYSQTFLDNSPILQAHKINTPMLLIAGTNDKRVDWKNSVKMQLALTRLEKESTLLLYKNENHVFIEKNNQIDISKKLMEWVDYRLKDKSKPHWN